MLARRFATDAGWASWSRAIGVIVAVFYAATAVVASIDPGGTGPAAWDGLLQRAALFSGLAWLSVVAWRLSATWWPAADGKPAPALGATAGGRPAGPGAG